MSKTGPFNTDKLHRATYVTLGLVPPYGNINIHPVPSNIAKQIQNFLPSKDNCIAHARIWCHRQGLNLKKLHPQPWAFLWCHCIHYGPLGSLERPPLGIPACLLQPSSHWKHCWQAQVLAEQQKQCTGRKTSPNSFGSSRVAS